MPYESAWRHASHPPQSSPEAVWYCRGGCYVMTHLGCAQSWARQQLDAADAKTIHSLGQIERDPGQAPPTWACPKCRHEYAASAIPRDYSCFCGKVAEPAADPWLLAHRCDLGVGGLEGSLRDGVVTGVQAVHAAVPVGPDHAWSELAEQTAIVHLTCSSQRKGDSSADPIHFIQIHHAVAAGPVAVRSPAVGTPVPCSATQVRRLPRKECLVLYGFSACRVVLRHCPSDLTVAQPYSPHFWYTSLPFNPQSLLSPGPCPPCPRMLLASCHCGAASEQRRCHSAAFACGAVCGRQRGCGHACSQPCHAVSADWGGRG